ncbi:hypothetical protein, partial [Cupriavidus sp. BIS7]|uniref:hypothetical protein n=1 Tax=Cupriavidus sp. BIS7 TaxID=1217718 RepID=UPI001ED94B2F
CFCASAKALHSNVLSVVFRVPEDSAQNTHLICFPSTAGSLPARSSRNSYAVIDIGPMQDVGA